LQILSVAADICIVLYQETAYCRQFRIPKFFIKNIKNYLFLRKLSIAAFVYMPLSRQCILPPVRVAEISKSLELLLCTIHELAAVCNVIGDL